MGDGRRFKAFAAFIAQTFPTADRIVDVAGGHGDLAFWLHQLGKRPVIVDPRESKFSGRVHRALRKESIRSGKVAQIERRRVSIEDLDLREFDLVVALHPDEATEPALRAALAHGIDFAIVPCCVFPLDGIKRSQQEWVRYLASLAPDIRISELPISGANLVLWRRSQSQDEDRGSEEGHVTASSMEMILHTWWRRLRPLSIQRSFPAKSTLIQVADQDGRVFVLKHVAHPDRVGGIEAQTRVLLYLDGCGVPVALPVETDLGQHSVDHAGRIYTLSRYLPGGTFIAADDLERAHRNMGRAIAHLHRALASYPDRVASWDMDLTSRVFDQAIPTIRRLLDPEERLRFEHELRKIEAEARSAFSSRPVQYIHGDCHAGNILVHNGEVSGFIDLDHLPRGPVIYDLAYLLADLGKRKLGSQKQIRQWLHLSGQVLAGYGEITRLSANEQRGIWPVMLAVQLLFTEFFLEAGNPTEARVNLDAFLWLAAHREEIRELLW